MEKFTYLGMDLKELLDFISWLRMLHLLLPMRQVIAISKCKYLGWYRNTNSIPTIPLADYGHDVMGRQIDPSWWITSRSSQFSTTGVIVHIK